MDGNLTALLLSGVVALHWQGKYWGPDFAPMHFTARTVAHERLKDSKGRLIPTVIASPLSEQGRDDIAKAVRSHEDELLALLANPANRKFSQRELAALLGWSMKDGNPMVGSDRADDARKSQADHRRTGPNRHHQEGPKGRRIACFKNRPCFRKCFKFKRLKHHRTRQGKSCVTSRG